ncbi:ExbD/TolR family protein [Dyella acidiphila]|nr:biopolymer transporter ExbD [Dyella acidiphila]
MAQINVTPLVDVLLVLLIIFMITSPIVTHKATMDLPQLSSKSPLEVVPPIHLGIHPDGEMDWNGTPIRADQLAAQLSIAASRAQQPALQIEAADGVAYDSVARVLAKAKAQGLVRIDMLGTR